MVSISSRPEKISMTKLHLLLKNGSALTRLTIDDRVSPSRLVDEVMSRSALPRIGSDGRPVDYEVVCLRTARTLNGSLLPLSSLVREGDTLTLRAIPTDPPKAEKGMSGPAAEQSTGRRPAGTEERLETFSLAAVKPFDLDYATQYPVLAIMSAHAHTGHPGIVTGHGSSGLTGSLFDRKQIYAKDVYFLMADLNGRVKWVAPPENRFYRREPGTNY